MGIKRLNRSRLYNVEKKGLDVADSIGAGAGIKEAIVSASQHREGYTVITDIVVDLGTSKAVVKSGGATENLPLGTDTSSATKPSNICKVTKAVFGIVSSLEIVCLEVATDGNLEDYNFFI